MFSYEVSSDKECPKKLGLRPDDESFNSLNLGGFLHLDRLFHNCGKT